MKPPATRSMPDGLWQFAPEWLKNWDTSLQATLAHGDRNPNFPWVFIRWITEEPMGILLGLALLFTGVLTLYRRRHLNLKRFFTKSALRAIACFALFLGASDLVATGLKRLFGRFKPHVDFYNPAFTPALSLPSNHAFNTAFALALVWFSVSDEKRLAGRPLFVLLATAAAFIGLSRVLLGQHYPLDILAGWTFGTLLARLLMPLYRAISFRTVRK